MTAFASVALCQLSTFAIAGDIPQQQLRKNGKCYGVWFFAGAYKNKTDTIEWFIELTNNYPDLCYVTLP